MEALSILLLWFFGLLVSIGLSVSAYKLIIGPALDWAQYFIDKEDIDEQINA